MSGSSLMTFTFIDVLGGTHVPHPARPQRRRPRRRGRLLHHALRHSPGQAPTGLRQLRRREPAGEAGALRERRRERHPQPRRGRAHLGRGGPRRGGPPRGRRSHPRCRGGRGVLPRTPGQALGDRPRRTALGELRGPRRRAPARGRRPLLQLTDRSSRVDLRSLRAYNRRMASGGGGTMRIAVLDDYEIVVAGITALLRGYEDRISVVELGIYDLPVHDVDIVLYDTFGHLHDHDLAVEQLSAGGRAKVVVFS